MMCSDLGSVIQEGSFRELLQTGLTAVPRHCDGFAFQRVQSSCCHCVQFSGFFVVDSIGLAWQAAR